MIPSASSALTRHGLYLRLFATPTSMAGEGVGAERGVIRPERRGTGPVGFAATINATRIE